MDLQKCRRDSHPGDTVFTPPPLVPKVSRTRDKGVKTKRGDKNQGSPLMRSNPEAPWMLIGPYTYGLAPSRSRIHPGIPDFGPNNIVWGAPPLELRSSFC